ncbi:hypothetical protein [Mucisphaera calidilacus]|uniref:Uncharacterized protein n=1 Tax=Mucisphaera calidilacus TaxID=2527982 RepID=A0A518BVM4_9BACT|nr:hypothetical protein [Mucisphaera calidilacus]QDU71030.1 hypothetical protein Pan265_08750 [Mucisphaera calidilacus]
MGRHAIHVLGKRILCTYVSDELTYRVVFEGAQVIESEVQRFTGQQLRARRMQGTPKLGGVETKVTQRDQVDVDLGRGLPTDPEQVEVIKQAVREGREDDCGCDHHRMREG